MCLQKFVSGLFLMAFFLNTNIATVFAQGKLQRITEAAADSGTDKKTSKSTSSSRGSGHDHRHAHHSYCDDDEEIKSLGDIGAEIFGALFLVGVTSPWWAPPLALADDSTEQAGFLSVPYQSGHHGGLDIVPFSQENVYDWQIRFLADYGTDFSGLQRLGGQFEIDTSSRLGFETSFNKFMEALEPTDDTLWTGDANLTYRFAQNEAMQFHAGVGMNWLHDVGKTEVGYNLMYGFDLFPKKPWVIRGTIDLGRIGDTSRIHYRGDVGLVWDHFEVFTGYDLERISNINLQTWTTGIQFRY